MTEEKKILENYYQRNATGFEFADKEQFGDVATYFGVSRIYIDRLEQQLSQLQQENEQLKADYGNKAQVERDILLQRKEELIKWLEEKALRLENEDIKPSKMKNKDFENNGRYFAYHEILSKLKESDKNDC